MWCSLSWEQWEWLKSLITGGHTPSIPSSVLSWFLSWIPHFLEWLLQVSDFSWFIMMTARAMVPFGLGLDLQFSSATCNCQGRVNQAQYLQFISFQRIPVSKCFGVFLFCFAWLGFLFCCLSRAVESVVRCLGAISAEADVKLFLIFFFF